MQLGIGILLLLGHPVEVCPELHTSFSDQPAQNSSSVHSAVLILCKFWLCTHNRQDGVRWWPDLVMASREVRSFLYSKTWSTSESFGFQIKRMAAVERRLATVLSKMIMRVQLNYDQKT